MIDVIWMVLIVTAIVFSVFTNNTSNTVTAISDGAKKAIELSLFLMGNMAFWLGIAQIAEKSGLLKKLGKLLSPIIDKLFPKFKNNNDVKNKITANITANMFGLGNAATPLGISAVNTIDDNGIYPSKEIILFVVINTASLQLIPTNMAALRSAYGSRNPFSILGCVLISSFGALVVSIALCKIIEVIKNANNC